MTPEFNTQIKKLTIGKSSSYFDDDNQRQLIYMVMSVCIKTKKFTDKNNIANILQMERPFSEPMPRQSTFDLLAKVIAAGVKVDQFVNYYENIFMVQFSKGITNDFDMYIDYIIYVGLRSALAGMTVSNMQILFETMIPAEYTDEYVAVTNMLLQQ